MVIPNLYSFHACRAFENEWYRGPALQYGVAMEIDLAPCVQLSQKVILKHQEPDTVVVRQVNSLSISLFFRMGRRLHCIF